MIKNLVICSLLCFSAVAKDPTDLAKGPTVVAKDPTVVIGADGKRYKLVKPETKLPTGAISIAEYVRIGEKEDVRYGMKLTPKGVAPSFWKLQG